MSQTPSQPHPYCGRFAPSPTGPLHFGSLVAALGSYLEARTHQGRWLVRIEDIDPDRAVPGIADDILHTLEHYGFEWDDAVSYQSQHLARFQAALDRLTDMQLVYPCGCSRKDIISNNQELGVDSSCYSGTCRQGMQGEILRSWRLNTGSSSVAFEDGLQGLQQAQMNTLGDPILKRVDGVFSYHLAVALDDSEGDSGGDSGGNSADTITHVVRGADLLELTFTQRYIMELLGRPVPEYTHLPMAVDARQVKLSKQTGAHALPLDRVSATLARALQFLGHTPPNDLLTGKNMPDPAELWAWAIQNWQLARVPKLKLRVETAVN